MHGETLGLFLQTYMIFIGSIHLFRRSVDTQRLNLLERDALL